MNAIPNYQQFMEPCLRVLATGAGLMPKPEVVRNVSDLVGLTDEQRQMMLDSGRSTVASSRISWALAYLKQANVIDNPRRGHYQITPRGEDLLAAPERPINTKLLGQFDEFAEFRQRSGTRSNQQADGMPSEDSELSPDEQLSSAAKAIRAEVQSQLLEQLTQVDPARFEHIVIDVLRAMGYGDSSDSTRVTGGTGDEGIDGVINEDVLGLDSIYVQAKRWQGAVGRPDVQGFAGALQGQNATKGVMITTSTFSDPARSFVEALAGTSIVLIDGVRLSGLMYDHGVGVSDATVITTRKLDTDYFSVDE